MSALRKLQKGMSKGALQTTRLARKTGGLVKDGAGIVKDGTIGIINDAKEGIKEGLQDEKSRELKRSNSGHFYESDDDDDDNPDLRMSLAIPNKPNNSNKKNFVAGYSIHPDIDDAHGAESDDELYLDAVPESNEGEIGLNDDGDDDSTGAQVRKKKKKVRKIKYRKDGEDSDGSDTKSAKSFKSSKSGKSGKSRKKKTRAGRSDASVGSRRKKKVDRDASPTRAMSSQSVQSETSSKKKKKKKPVQAFESSDDDDEKNDMLSPLTEKKPVLPTRSKSPSRSPATRKKTFEDKTPPLSPAISSNTLPDKEHPIKQELMRFSAIWTTQAEEQERESIKVGKISAIMGELNGEVKEELKEAADPYDNDFLDAKLRSTEQKLLDSEAKVEELIVKKSDIQKELNEEQLRNDELGRKLLYLEDRVEELENEKQELESAPRVVEQQADPIEVFELQQEVNQLKTDMSIQMDQHSEVLFAKDERIKELEAKLEATAAGDGGGGGFQTRESITSIHSTVSQTNDARTQGLLLRSQDKIANQEEEIKALKQKLQELGNADIIEQKDEEITNLGVQMSELETKMKEMEEKHQKALKEKEETINFFQMQVVEMQKKMPRPAAYTAREKVGTEGTMSLGGEGDSEERGNGLWGAISGASPGWLGGRQTMDRRRTREGAPGAPNL